MGEMTPHQLFRHCLKLHSKERLIKYVLDHPGYIPGGEPPYKWTKDLLAEWVVEAEYGAGSLLAPKWGE